MKKKKKLDEEELKKDNSFTSNWTKINEWKFMYGKTRFTLIGSKINKIWKRLRKYDNRRNTGSIRYIWRNVEFIWLKI